MRTFFVFLFLLFSTAFCFANDELILSTPEELGSQNMGFLIKGLVSPLSGNLSLKETDLVIRGAQEIRLERIYTPPHIPSSFHDKKKHVKDWDQYFLHDYLLKNYKGWQCFPHARLELFPKDKIVRTCDSNGMTLDFQVFDGGTYLVSDAYGMSNVSGEVPSGKNDPRNTKISFGENVTKIVVRCPDGTSRIYQLKGG